MSKGVLFSELNKTLLTLGKRRRTLESGDEVHRLESANQITV